MNMTLESNGTNRDLHPTEIPKALESVTLFVCIAVITLGVIGNGLVLIVFGLKGSNLKSYEIFLFNLALADLLNSTCTPVKTIFDLVHISLYSIGHNGCKLISFIGLTSMTVSALTLLAVSVDRLLSIKRPMNQRPHLRSLLTVISIWLVASGLGIFYFIDGNIKLGLHVEKVYSCFNYMKKDDFERFSIAVICVQCVIPIILMTALYSVVIFELKKTAKNSILTQCKIEIKLKLKQNKKATKMIFLLVLVFYVCVLPSNSFFMWYLFYGQKHPLLTIKIIYDILIMLQMCNSIVNPIIYSILHASFKKDIVTGIFSCCNKKRKKWNSMQDTVQSMLSYSKPYRERLTSNSSFESRKIQASSTSF